ncbi:MAG: glycosyltransferase [Vicinamibacterales bacterium]
MNILFLQKRVLFPVNSGWRIRTLNVVRYLARWHRLTYVCNVDDGDRDALAQMRELGLELVTVPWTEAPRRSAAFYRDLARNLASPYPFTVDKDFQPELRGAAAHLLASRPFDLLICDFVQMARNAIGLEARATLLFQHNVEGQLAERHAREDPSWLRRRYMSLQASKMKAFEGRAGREFDSVVAVSEQDRRIFEREYGWTNVHTIDTSVDVDYFQPGQEPRDPATLVFVGSLDWLPNEDGVVDFVSHVWPSIRRQVPDAKFHAVGRNPSPAVRRLDGRDGVEIFGSVPDVRPFLHRATMAVVPLLVGGGTRLKVFEAMATATPVVSTTLGAEGLPVASGEHLSIADGHDAFAAAVVDLVRDRGRRETMAARARQLVLERFSAETIARQFEAICLQTVERASARRTT